MTEVWTLSALRQAAEQAPGLPVTWDFGPRIGTVLSAAVEDDGLHFELEID